MSAPDRIWIDTFSKVETAPNWLRKPVWAATEYARLDPNTRVVTVDQLDRLELRLRYAGFARSADEIRAIIGEVKP